MDYNGLDRIENVQTLFAVHQLFCINIKYKPQGIRFKLLHGYLYKCTNKVGFLKSLEYSDINYVLEF